MDYKNKSIPIDVNKAIQRSLTKAVARHGLGLYIYAGEDLPEDDKNGSKPDSAPRLSRARMRRNGSIPAVSSPWMLR